MEGFKITGSRGFHITFDNDVTVSVQFGGANYGDNYDMRIGSEPTRHILESREAEIMLWGPGGQGRVSELTTAFSSKDTGGVLGWKSPAQVLEALNWAASYKPEEAGDASTD